MESTTEKFGSIYGFSSEYLASMLSPEAVLCDQVCVGPFCHTDNKHRTTPW
jgi:hypothetical protein